MDLPSAILNYPRFFLYFFFFFQSLGLRRRRRRLEKRRRSKVYYRNITVKNNIRYDKSKHAKRKERRFQK